MARRFMFYLLSVLVMIAVLPSIHSVAGSRQVLMQSGVTAKSTVDALYCTGVPGRINSLWVLDDFSYIFSQHLGLRLGNGVSMIWFNETPVSVKKHGSGVFILSFSNGSIVSLDSQLNVLWSRDTEISYPLIHVVGDTVYVVSKHYEHGVMPGETYIEIYSIDGEPLGAFTGEAVSRGTNKLGLAEQFFIEALKTITGHSVTVYTVTGEVIYHVNSSTDGVEMRVSAAAGLPDRAVVVLTYYDPLRETTVFRMILYSGETGVIDDSFEAAGDYSGDGYIAIKESGAATIYTYLVLRSGRAMAIHGSIDSGGIHVEYMEEVPAPTATPATHGGTIVYVAGDTLVVLGGTIETHTLSSEYGSDTLIHVFNDTKILLYNPVTRIAAVAEAGIGEVYVEENVDEITAAWGPYVAISRSGVYSLGRNGFKPVPGLEYVVGMDEHPGTGAVYVARTLPSGALVLEKRINGVTEKRVLLADEWDNAYIYAGPGRESVTVAVRNGEWINLSILDADDLVEEYSERILADGTPLFLENRYLYAVISYSAGQEPLYWRSYLPATDTVAASAGDTLYVARWKYDLFAINYTGGMELHGTAIYVQWFRGTVAYLSASDDAIHVVGGHGEENIPAKHAKPVFSRSSVGALYRNGTLVLYNVSSHSYIRVEGVADAYSLPGIDEVLIVTRSGAIGAVVNGAVALREASPPLPSAAEYTASRTPYLHVEGLFYRVTGVEGGAVEAVDTLVAPISVGIALNATAPQPLWVTLAAYSIVGDSLVPAEKMIHVKIYRADGSLLEEDYGEASVINVSLPPGTVAVGVEPRGGPPLIYPLTRLTYVATPLAEPLLSISINAFNYTHMLLRQAVSARYKYTYTGVEAGYTYMDVLYYGGFYARRLYANITGELWATGWEKPLHVNLEPRGRQGIHIDTFYGADPVEVVLPVNDTGTVTIESWATLSITGSVEITRINLFGTGLNTTIHVTVNASAAGRLTESFTYNVTAEPRAELYVFTSRGRQYYAVILRGVPASLDDSRVERIRVGGESIEPGSPASVKESRVVSPLTVNDTDIPVYAEVADIGLLYIGELPGNASRAEVTYSYSGALPYRAALVAPVKNLGNVSRPADTLLELLNSEGAAGESGASTAQGEGGASGTAPGAGEELSSMGNTSGAGPGEAGGQPPYLLLALAVVATLVLVTAYMWRHRR